MREALKTKEDSLCQAKDEAIQEYQDSEALLGELATSFADGFDDCLRQVKASYPDLSLAHFSIDPKSQTPARPVNTEDTDKLFGGEQSDGEA